MKGKGSVFSFLIVVSLLLTVCAAMSGCTFRAHGRRQIQDMRKVIRNDLHIETIYIECGGGEFLTDCYNPASSMGGRFYLGEREGKEVLIYFPASMRYEPYEVTWPFSFTFKESIAQLNSTERGVICTLREIIDKKVDIYIKSGCADRPVYENDAGGGKADLEFYLEFYKDHRRYYISQANGVCAIRMWENDKYFYIIGGPKV